MNKQTEYVESLSALLVALDTQIDQLKDQAKSGAYEVTSENSDSISALQLKRDEAAQKLQGIAPTSDDEWGDVKAGSEDVADEVRSMVKDAITKIR
jgi:hypothetical protein